MDQTDKQSAIDRLQQATNVLVTVSSNPSVDQLAACLGFTLFLNHTGKHATAVFSGKIPAAINFLEPGKTIEKNTDSLRDFIIALDKGKADKLRYKVENDIVKIFITPYRTSISKDDFDFSQGDFNVDVVVALGVHAKEELDQAITAHGRILHDATVISINNAKGSNLGTINWQDQQASSLCEMLVDMAEVMRADSFDAQMATAFMTGIVAETKRFSNDKTSPKTMSLSAKLMAAGANQQLVAAELQKQLSGAVSDDSTDSEEKDDGTLEIEHQPDEEKTPKHEEKDVSLPEPVEQDEPLPPEDEKSPIGDVKKEDFSKDVNDLLTSTPSGSEQSASYPTEPPTRGGTFTANTKPEQSGPAVDPLSSGDQQAPASQPDEPTTPTTSKSDDLDDKTLDTIESALDKDKTLSDIEKTVDSPHSSDSDQSAPKAEADLEAARDAVLAAADQSEPRPEPNANVGAQTLDPDVQGPHAPAPVNEPPQPPATPVPPPSPQAPPANPLLPPDNGPAPSSTNSTGMPAPPPVPPPMTMPSPSDNSSDKK